MGIGEAMRSTCVGARVRVACDAVRRTETGAKLLHARELSVFVQLGERVNEDLHTGEGLSGDLTTSRLTGAGQVGTGLVYNGNEKPFGSFSAWLSGNCQANATISASAPRVPNGMGVMIPNGQVGTLKFNVGAAVGLILTPRTAAWRGIRALHKTGLTTSTITSPVLRPVC